jgi:hypothetical protein
MRTNQLALRLEDDKKSQQLWTTLSPETRNTIARVYARLCVRAAKMIAGKTVETKEANECNPNR